jgi:excisionase family DNA binding protein
MFVMPHETDQLPRYVRIGTASQLLGVSARTLRRWCDQGRIQYHRRLSGQRAFEVAYLRRLLE